MTEAEQDRADMRRLQGGDGTALDPIMERWQLRLRTFLMRRGLSDPDACDLAQDTFVRVFRHAHRFDPRRTFSTWVFQIALNLVRDRQRRRQRVTFMAMDAVPEPATRHTPASDSDSAEKAQAVREAIGLLPDRLREVLILAEYDHLPHVQIGEIVGATPKAVETRLYRAREQLRKSLRRWLED